MITKAFLRRQSQYVPGLFTAIIIALAATFISSHYGGPTLIYALFFGIAFHFLAEDEKTKAGIDFAARSVLRLGVALLGARIVFSQMADLGWQPLALIAGAVVVTLVVGALLGSRLLASSGTSYFSPQALISSGSVAICGASAALAIAAVMPPKAKVGQFTIMVVVGVTSISTIAMVLYPPLGIALGLSQQEMGIFIGGTIHDVAQVVGAGYALSDQTGDTATIIKLFRVALLLPVVLFLSMLFRSEQVDSESQKKPPLVPLFLVGFVVLATINSLGFVPVAISSSVSQFSRWCLVIAIAALGVKTSFQEIIALGWKPVLVLVGNSLVIAVLVLVGLVLLR